MSSSRSDWLLFLALGGIWGSSYLFIKIGVEAGLPPLTLVMLRLAIGFGLLAAVVAAAREPLPRDPRVLGHLGVMAVLSIAIPFSLIAAAEQRVDSTLAATLNGAIPLLVVPLAAVVLRTERITVPKVAGVVVGFVGVALVVGFDPATLASGDGLAEIALLGATASYALGAVYARWAIHGLRPMIPAVFQVGLALVIVSVAAFAFERPLDVAVRPEGWFAVAWLGVLGSGAAYLLFFRLLGRWGATRTSLVAYLLPVVGIALGVVVLGEPASPGLIGGAALVLAGIVFVNRAPAPAAATAPGRTDEAVRAAGRAA